MQAKDVMVSPVISVMLDTTVAEIARMLLEHRISAVPVLDRSGGLVGIVSEGDLLHRVETGTERRRSWWLHAFVTSQALAADYVKAHSRKAADVMTAPVVTVAEQTPLSEIAILLERHGIKRVPVARKSQVIGIVSRANLLQGLASDHARVDAPEAIDDHAIRERILSELKAQPWRHSWLLNVTVKDGVVDLWGPLDSAQERRAFEVIAENTPGVRAVNSRLVPWPTHAS